MRSNEEVLDAIAARCRLIASREIERARDYGPIKIEMLDGYNFDVFAIVRDYGISDFTLGPNPPKLFRSSVIVAP